VDVACGRYQFCGAGSSGRPSLRRRPLSGAKPRSHGPGRRTGDIERAQRFNALDSKLPEREAELAIETGDWDRMEDAYDRAIQVNPEHYAPYMFMGLFHERREEFEKAFFYYQEAFEFNPLDYDFNRRVSRLREGDRPGSR
jgi:tetratricopeptide (TPR) repeat protein